MTVYVDTREQSPILFSGSVRRTLKVGDYTTSTLLHKFVIERKSPQDLYGTLLKGHRRFKRELQKAETLGIELVIYVEVSRKDFLTKNYRGAEYQKTPGKTLEKIIVTMELRYDLEFVWCKNKLVMGRRIWNRLRKQEQHVRNKNPKQYV